MARIAFTVQEKDLAAQLEHMYLHAPHFSRRIRKFQIMWTLYCLIFLFMVAYSAYSIGWTTRNVFFGLGFAVLIVYAWTFLPSATRRKWRNGDVRMHRESTPNHSFGAYVLDVEGQKLRTNSPLGELVTPICKLHDFVETETHHIVCFDALQGVPIRKNSVEEGDVSEFARSLREAMESARN